MKTPHTSPISIRRIVAGIILWGVLIGILSSRNIDIAAMEGYETKASVDELRQQTMALKASIERLKASVRNDKVEELTPLDRMNQDLHIVFSTGCTTGPKQSTIDLSDLLLQHSAKQVGHRGPMTRIVSGCSAEQKQMLRARPTLYPNYRLHFTRAFSPNPMPGVNDSYAPYNKPFGLRDWLEQTNITESLVALIDADFLFLRPLVVNTHSLVRYNGTHRNPAQVYDTVKDGVGLAQDWHNFMGAGMFHPGMRAQHLNKICQGQPCLNVTRDDGDEYYSPTGPPYVMTMNDMRRLIDDYCTFTVAVRKTHKTWMSEMYGFAVAAANQGIKFTIGLDLGVTHPKMGRPTVREFWSFTERLTVNPCSDEEDPLPIYEYPVALHLCGLYTNMTLSNGETWTYFKRSLPPRLLECQGPLLALPPPELYERALELNGTTKPAEAWLHCTATKQVNAALIELRKKQCPTGYRTDTIFKLTKTT